MIGIYRSKRPGVFGLASGISCFGYGSIFWASRTAFLHVRPFCDNPPSAPPSPKDRLRASTLAGAFAGGVTGVVFYGRRGFIPRMLTITALGYTGQRTCIYLTEAHTAQLENPPYKKGEGWIDKVASLKWTGLQKLGDEEYAAILGRELLKVEAEIALIDEKIETLKLEEKQEMKGR